MADFSHLKKKNRLGDPPKETEIKHNLNQPESFEVEKEFLDKRTLRKTGRTHQLATRVNYDFYKRVKRLALNYDMTIAELIENAIDLYEKHHD